MAKRKLTTARKPASKRASTPYSLKGALINRLCASKADGGLCSTGQERLKWWLKEGLKFPTITDALKTWTPQQIDAFLDWLGMDKIASGLNIEGYIREIDNKVRYDWSSIPGHKETPLMNDIKAAFKKHLGAAEDIPTLITKVVKDDHYFDDELKDWDW